MAIQKKSTEQQQEPTEAAHVEHDEEGTEQPREADQIETVEGSGITEVAEFTEGFLTAKSTTKKMLQEACKQRDLADDGTKGTLAGRLRAADRPLHAFPSRSRCPRCNVTDTEAYRVNGNIQYRRCRRAICRHRYTVLGTKI